MEIYEVLTNLKSFDCWDFKSYSLSKAEAEAIIKKLDRPKGKWKLYKSKVDCYDIAGVKTWANTYRCECGFIHTVIEDFGKYDFCPNCGLEMEV